MASVANEGILGFKTL